MNPSSPNFRHLQQLMGQILEGVILIDLSGTILSANEAALQMHGTNHLADLGSTIEDYAARFQLRAEDGRLLKRREYPLFRLLAGDSFPDETIQVGRASEDEVRWVHRVRDVVMDEDGGEPDYLALVIGDVSAEFDAEVRFRAMFNANPAPALVIRLSDLRIVDANPGFLQLTDYPLDQLSGRGLFELDLLTGMTNAAEVRQRIMQAYPVGQTEAELLVADGNRRLVIFACQPIDVTGVDALLLTFADLEPRRQAEQALRASERHLVSIFEMAPVAMAITHRADCTLSRTNAAFRALTGHEDAHSIGRTGMDLGLWLPTADGDSPDTQAVSPARLRQVDSVIHRRDGTIVNCLVSAEAIDVDGIECMLWVYQDVTNRRRSEMELADAIEEVMKDASWLSRSILDKLAMLRQPGGKALPAELTMREREVLELICDDLGV